VSVCTNNWANHISDSKRKARPRSNRCPLTQGLFTRFYCSRCLVVPCRIATPEFKGSFTQPRSVHPAGTYRRQRASSAVRWGATDHSGTARYLHERSRLGALYLLARGTAALPMHNRKRRGKQRITGEDIRDFL